MSHVPYPGCYCADCVEGTPSARITGDKDRSVQSRAPTDLTARLHSFAKALETGFDFNVMKHLDVSMCCDGHMCGCQGSTVGQYLAHQLRGELPEEKLAEANRRLALARHRHQAERETLARMGWRDIESAPKDGTWFTAYWPVQTFEDRVQTTRWLHDDYRFVDASDFMDDLQPIAWMPLPPAPEAGQ